NLPIKTTNKLVKAKLRLFSYNFVERRSLENLWFVLMMRRSAYASKKTGQPNSTNPISCSPSDLFRTKERQKSIDIESICQLLDLVLGSQFRAQVDYFIEYLKIQSDYKVINLDQWMGFF
ncbi:hypothetical protein ES288_D07G157800v1, partial [Gossypium darwinii]